MVHDGDTGPRWVTLREAQAATGASVAALRRWYRQGLIASVAVPATHGPQRLVDLDEVVARAAASPGIARRTRAEGPAPADVTAALIEQVASMSMELAELRERVAALEGG